jgi:hypothetical protein
MPTLSSAAWEQIRAIAETALGLETLNARNSDSLDFHNLSVWQIKDALKSAYLAGMVDHRKDTMTGTPAERPMTRTEQTLTDYLGGYIRNSPANREHVINYPDWPRMARLELDRRSARFLEVLPEKELHAIAEGQISLPDLVNKLSA